jgi:NADH:ubiquinone oxidoreductase subunit 5 (subunit L)/multisubunit Na+/H+ antiporter MnhA subunit
MLLILVIILLIILLGGGYWGYNSGSYGPFGGLLGLFLLIVVVLWLTGNLALR